MARRTVVKALFVAIGRAVLSANRIVGAEAAELKCPFKMAPDVLSHLYKTAESTEAGWAMRERLGREEGLVVGHSSGASVEAALRVAQGLTEGVIVCICCDHGDRYFDPRKLQRGTVAGAHV